MIEGADGHHVYIVCAVWAVSCSKYFLCTATSFLQVFKKNRDLDSQICSFLLLCFSFSFIFASLGQVQHLSHALLLLTLQNLGAGSELLEQQSLHFIGVRQRFSLLFQQLTRVEPRTHACHTRLALVQLLFVSLVPIHFQRGILTQGDLLAKAFAPRTGCFTAGHLLNLVRHGIPHLGKIFLAHISYFLC